MLFSKPISFQAKATSLRNSNVKGKKKKRRTIDGYMIYRVQVNCTTHSISNRLSFCLKIDLFLFIIQLLPQSSHNFQFSSLLLSHNENK